MVKNNRVLEILTWKDVRDQVRKVNPELATVIDEFAPDNEFQIVKACYSFGVLLLNEGNFFLPDVASHQEGVLKKAKELLSYSNSIPVGMVLDKSLELFLKVDHKNIPYSLIQKGKIFGLWASLYDLEFADFGKLLSISAGARNLMMVPKISDSDGFKYVKREFNISLPAPKTLEEQWNIFVQLANHDKFPRHWEAEVIFFSKKWLEKTNDPKQKLFREYLMGTIWEDVIVLRKQLLFDLTSSLVIATKNLKSNPYLADTIKHLYAIGIKAYPAFVFADDDSAAPITEFQNIFLDLYGLHYCPVMAHSGYFSATNAKKPSYYTLELPTLMSFSPKSRKITSKLDDIREIKYVMDAVAQHILDNSSGLRKTAIHKWIQTVKYEYFHSETDRYNESIMHVSKLPNEDTNLSANLRKFKKLRFSSASPFIRGCIKISAK